ncbi:hypothetical protein EYF80_050224 [Liparis tanakae]|uniref:Uncharacterized protein n=1 Tax=Liparis tanakae TaxID=230148 RepID=A0A4Z2FEE0_9TELE|nr:hypothetical protein EYF80_050224 [Liparis tanakae]
MKPQTPARRRPFISPSVGPWEADSGARSRTRAPPSRSSNGLRFPPPLVLPRRLARPNSQPPVESYVYRQHGNKHTYCDYYHGDLCCGADWHAGTQWKLLLKMMLNKSHG